MNKEEILNIIRKSYENEVAKKFSIESQIEVLESYLITGQTESYAYYKRKSQLLGEIGSDCITHFENGRRGNAMNLARAFEMLSGEMSAIEEAALK